MKQSEKWKREQTAEKNENRNDKKDAPGSVRSWRALEYGKEPFRQHFQLVGSSLPQPLTAKSFCRASSIEIFPKRELSAAFEQICQMKDIIKSKLEIPTLKVYYFLIQNLIDLLKK